MYFGHVMRKNGYSLEEEIMQGTTPGSRSRGRPKTAWMSNITSWTGLSVEQLLRAVDDRYQWRLTADDAANLRAHGRWIKTKNTPNRSYSARHYQINEILTKYCRYSLKSGSYYNSLSGLNLQVVAAVLRDSDVCVIATLRGRLFYVVVGLYRT